MINRRRCLLVCLLCCLCLAGCWDTTPINSRTIISTLALDPGSSPDSLRLTVQSPSVQGLRGMTGGSGKSGVGGSGGSEFVDTSGEGPTLAGAFDVIERHLSRQPYLGQTQVVVFSPTLDPGMLAGAVDSLMRLPTVDKTVWIMEAQGGAAADLIHQESPQEKLPALYLDTLFEESTPATVNVREPLWSFYIASVIPGGGGFMPLISVSEQGYAVSGLALFSGFRMVGTLDPKETLGWALVRSQAFKYSETVLTPWGTVDVRALRASSQVHATFHDGRPFLSVQTTVTGVLGQAPDTYGLVDQQLLDAVQPLVAARVRVLEEATIARAQRMGADPFGFGTRLAADSPQRFAALGPWGAEFGRLHVDVTTKARIRSAGNVL